MGIYGNVYLDCDHAAPTDVRDGVQYNNDQLLGTYVGGGGVVDYPPEARVVAGTEFGDGTLVGSFIVPAESQVLETVTFGFNSEFTGALELPSIPTVPAESDVLFGVQFGINGTQFTGTCILPTPNQVLVGVNFGANGEFAGTLDGTTATVADYQQGETIYVVCGDDRKTARGTALRIVFDDVGAELHTKLTAAGSVKFAAARGINSDELVAESVSLEHLDDKTTFVIEIDQDATGVCPGTYQYQFQHIVPDDDADEPDNWTFAYGSIQLRATRAK